MVNNFVAANAQEIGMANSKRIRPSDLNNKALDSERFVPIWEVQSNRTEVYAPGIGNDDRSRGNVGYADLDLQADGTGSGNAGDEVNGDLRWEMYGDSSREDLRYVSDTFRTEDLRADVTQSRTEKTVIRQLAPAAPQDGYVVLALKANAGSDGYVVDDSTTNTNVDVGIPYAKIR